MGKKKSWTTSNAYYGIFEFLDMARTIKAFNYYLKRFDKAWTELAKR